MDYSKLHWQCDYMLNEIQGLDYDEIPEEENKTIGYYTMIDFPEINLYIDVEEGKILEVWLSEEE